MKKLEFEAPWSIPNSDDCYFYHTMEFPDGETFTGDWTIPDFSKYIGNYNVSGKTILDIGTATGYLAFNAEKAGAKEVTGFDIKSSKEIRLIPFAVNESPIDHESDSDEIRTRNSWWYGWHKNKSAARCIYAPIADLYNCDLMVDVVIAGAVLEHISDPVYAIGAWAKVAREAVLIPFTPVIHDDELFMKTATDWNNPHFCFTWWTLSTGLFKRVFDNLGFDVEFSTPSAAIFKYGQDGPVPVERPSIIAKRR